MTGVYDLLDRLGESIGRLTEIHKRISPHMAVTATYAPRTTLGSPDNWWETLKQWVTVGIPGWIGPLSDLYRQLVEAGVITPAQAEKGLSKEELIALIKEIMAEEKPWYQSPWLPVAIGVGVVGGAGAYYVVKKKRR